MLQTRLVRTLFTAAFALGATTLSAAAEPDIAKGEKSFKKCAVCHSLEEGKRKAGPSLFKVIGRQAGIAPNWKYSKSYVEAGEKGLKWTPENLIPYLENPKDFLREYLGDKKARSKMVMRFKKQEERENVAAYLQSLQNSE